MKRPSLILIAAIALASCSGGGGSTPTPAPHTNATLRVGAICVGTCSGGNKASIHKVKNATPILSGGIVPFATFVIPDLIIDKNAAPSFNYEAVAYLDTSNGSTLPSTLPTVTFAIASDNGTGITLGDVLSVPTPNPASTKAIIGAQNLSQPTGNGQEIITVTSTDGYGTLNLTADSYYGLAMAVPGDTSGDASQVSFDTNGRAQLNTANPDVTIALNANGAPVLSDPNGIMEIQEDISLATPSQFNMAAAATTITANNVCVAGAINTPQSTTFLINTKNGGVVAWEIGGNATLIGNFSDNNCDWNRAYGPYTKL